MSDDLTNSQIEIVCEIEEYDPSQLTGDQKRDLELLVAGGFVEQTANHPGTVLILTAKGIQFLSERGPGLNEA
jgi:hypothetical protein